MFLSAQPQSLNESFDFSLVESGAIIGADSEPGEFIAEATASLHNLDMAMARYEHGVIMREGSMHEGALTEAADLALQEGVKEWFASTGKKIADAFRKLIAWIKAKIEDIRTKVFGPRAEWYSNHAAELSKLSDFGGAKASVPQSIGGFHEAAARVGKIDVVAMAKQNGNEETAKKAIAAILTPARGESESVAAFLKKTLIGVDKEEALSKAVVTKMMAAYDETTKLPEELSAIQTALAQKAKVVENIGTTKMDPEPAAASKGGASSAPTADSHGFDAKSKPVKRSDVVDGAKNPANSKARYQMAVGREALSQTGAFVTALTSTMAEANAKALGVLVKAYNAGKSSLKESTDVTGAVAGAAGGVLAAYM